MYSGQEHDLAHLYFRRHRGHQEQILCQNVRMPEHPNQLPTEIQAQLRRLIPVFSKLGWELTEARYTPQIFGNWYIKLAKRDLSFTMIKDRSQFMVDGVDIEKLKAAGLWRAFDDLNEFEDAIIAWLESLSATDSAEKRIG